MPPPCRSRSVWDGRTHHTVAQYSASEHNAYCAPQGRSGMALIFEAPSRVQRTVYLSEPFRHEEPELVNIVKDVAGLPQSKRQVIRDMIISLTKHSPVGPSRMSNHSFLRGCQEETPATEFPMSCRRCSCICMKCHDGHRFFLPVASDSHSLQPLKELVCNP